MEVQIALSPDMGLDPETFAAAWNADPECARAVQATLTASPREAFDPTLLTVTLTVLGCRAAGVAGNASPLQNGVLGTAKMRPPHQGLAGKEG